MGITSSLLRFARSVVHSVMNQINQQVSIVRESAMSPINQMIQQVTNGIWRGKGADAFVNEIQTDVLPAFANLLTGVGNTHNQINRAIEIMHNADTTCSSKVGGLVDVFRGIF
jgi:hypothetical protein